jgi:uncharacterized alpha-E superfamily protein
MYRQYCQPQVQGFRVIDFLLCDRAFPRSIAFCMDSARSSCAALPRSEAASAALDTVDSLLQPMPADPVSATDVTALMDTVQKRLADVHEAVVATWFLHEDAA